VATEITMPRLSDTMESGTIARWLKHEGDPVRRGEIIAEIETDKSNMELESYANGILAQIIVGEGESAGLGQPIALVASSQEEAAQLKQAPGAPQPQGEKPRVEVTSGDGRGDVVIEQETVTPQPAQGPPAAAESAPSPPARDAAPQGRIKASPLARRLAQEHEVNLVEVSGTGPGGRITKGDVLAYVRGMGAPRQPEAPRQPAETARQPAPEAAPGRGAQSVEMTRMQQTIARRMVEAKSAAPEFVLTAEYDMTEAQALLAGLKATEGAPKVGPNDLLIKAVAVALRRHPEINAGWENGTMTRYSRVNVGFAVALPDGLVVPVIQDADMKTLSQVAEEARSLIDKARGGKLAPSERENGTFTVSNLGMYGIDQFTPIINPPESCIMGVGAITQKAVVVDGAVTVRARMRVTLSCDHRVVYGAQGAEFLQTLRKLLESPVLALV